MAQYDLVFVRNNDSGGLSFGEILLPKPADQGMFLTQHPSTGTLSWSKYHWDVSGNNLISNIIGNVGFGVPVPLQKLDVAGDINVSNGMGFRINNTGNYGTFLRGNGTRYTTGTIQASDLPNHDHDYAAGWILDTNNNLTRTDKRVSVGSDTLLRNSAFQVYSADRNYAEMLVYTDDGNFSDLNVIALTNYDQLTAFRGLVVNSLVGSKPSTVEYPSLVLAGFVGDPVSSGMLETSFSRLYPDHSTTVHGLKINHIYDQNQSVWGSYGSLFMEPTGTAIFDIYNYNSSVIPNTLRLLDQNSNMIEFRVDPYNAGINEIVSNSSMVLSGNGTAIYLTGSGVGFGVLPEAIIHMSAGSTGRAPLKFTPGTLLTGPQSGAVEFDGTRLYITANSVREKLAHLKDVGLKSSQTTVINATAHLTPTVIVGTDVGNNTIAANTFAVGDEVVTKIAGVFNSAANVQNITVRVLLNSTVIKTITGWVQGGASAWDWTGDITFTIKTAGATGKGLLTGMFFMEARNTGYANVIPLTSTTEIDVNTTQNNTITVDAQWANSGNSLKSIQSSVQLLKVN